MSDLLDLSDSPDLPNSPGPTSLALFPSLADLADPSDPTEPPDPQRPAELDPSALSLAENSPDAQALPTGLTPETLFTTPQMSRRRIHLGALLLGLAGPADSDASDAD
jgi:hypothetical protein